MHVMHNYHFKGQEAGEEILEVIRRHWFDILIQYIPIFFVLIVILGGFAIVPVVSPYFYEEYYFFLLFIETLLFLVLWVHTAVVWIDYYLDVWIITNKRIVNVEQKGLFLRHVSELRYQKIQDVTTEVGGIIPTFLNYGDVYIQTAGTEARFLFHHVPNPYGIKAILVQLQKRARKKDLGQLEKMLNGNPRDV